MKSEIQALIERNRAWVKSCEATGNGGTNTAKLSRDTLVVLEKIGGTDEK